jgi:hypothetical protein
VQVSSDLGNVDTTAVTTDFNGQATIRVTASVAGDEIIQASALGALATFPLTVSAANFEFTEPEPDPEVLEVNLGEDQTITVHWDEAGANQQGQRINFFATRGTLTDPGDPTNTGAAITVLTDDDGNATVSIASTNAGPAIITAAADTPEGPSSELEVEFVATNPTSLILQASPTTLSVNRAGSTDQQSIITAIVRDAENNLVKNQRINFVIFSDVSAGRIFPSFAETDSFGRASTIYTASAAPSGQDGVLIDAQVVGTTGCDPTDAIPAGPCDRVALTVAGEALFMTLGTGNEITEPTSTNYNMPFKVIVTDATSNPVAGVRVELNLTPLQFFKGNYVELLDPITQAFIRWVPDISAVCVNEDILTGDITKDRNGILDVDEDRNDSGELEPGNVATVPTSVVTGDDGIAEFIIDYAQDYANWVTVELEARTTVAGSESSATRIFTLPVLAADVTDRNVSPPGFESPFGVSSFCTDDL